MNLHGYKLKKQNIIYLIKLENKKEKGLQNPNKIRRLERSNKSISRIIKRLKNNVYPGATRKERIEHRRKKGNEHDI